MNNLCFRCKGRNFCNRGFCALRQKIQVQKNFNQNSKKDFFGENYNVFVGRQGYPNINIGLLNIDIPKKDTSIDNPSLWAKDNYDISRIISLRSNLINSNFRTSIKGFNERFMEIAKEVSLSTDPVDTEISLEKKPQFKLTFNQEITPFGPSIKLERARITENPKIPKKVDSLINDEVSARESISTLYNNGFNEHYLTKILSIGNLGTKANKKIVPTRWSITAIDDTIGKGIISKVKNYKASGYAIYSGGYLGNEYIILCLPEPWAYELFETLVATGESSHDYEGFSGRTSYAKETAGGYYAARLGILEHLADIKRQSTIIALRFVTDDYWAPLGVWVVREAVRKTIKNKPIYFDTFKQMLDYATNMIKIKFNIDSENILKNSVLLKDITFQRKLAEFT
jgi:hypothetical protein